jgi:hypothetical protein
MTRFINKKMDKKLLLIIVFCFSLNMVFAQEEEICTGIVEPNTNCQMVSPSIYCDEYTYQLYYKNSTLIREANLTLWVSPDIYYFNFSEGIGEYFVKLCDDTTREINVKVSEEKMQSIIIGFIAVFIYFLIMGFAIKNIYVRFGSFVLAFTELVMMVFVNYGSYQGGNILPVLETNFWIMMLIGFGLFMYKWIEQAMILMTSARTEKNEKDGWNNDWTK